MSDPPRALFAYGTLQVPEILEALCGRALRGLPAQLEGFARGRIRDRVYPGVAPRSGATTSGRVYLDLREADLAVLDAFEGELYDRRPLAVSPLDGSRAVPAWVYVLAPTAEPLLRDEAWDLAGFERAHAPRYVQRCRALRAQLVRS